MDGRGASDGTEGRIVAGRRLRPGEVAGNDFTYVVIEPIAATGDRRVDRRLRTRLRDASLSEEHGRALVECRIRDRSRDGARLQLVEDRPLPKRFVLTDPGSSSRFRATLRWQVGRDAGVKLTPVVPKGVG